MEIIRWRKTAHQKFLCPQGGAESSVAPSARKFRERGEILLRTKLVRRSTIETSQKKTSDGKKFGRSLSAQDSTPPADLNSSKTRKIRILQKSPFSGNLTFSQIE